MIRQSSSYFFWKIFLISLLLQALNEVSQSNIFLDFFFYIWSFQVKIIFIIIIIFFCSVSSIFNGSFYFSLFSSKLLLYLIKILATGRPVAKIFDWIYEKLCVFTALLQEQIILMWIQSPKLIYELFLIYS